MGRGKKKGRLLTWLLSFIFALSMSAAWGSLLSRNQVFAADFSETTPKMKMYTRCQRIETAVTKKNLRCAGGTYETVSRFFDGVEESGARVEQACQVTWDLGEKRMLAGVRVLPDASGEPRDRNCCLGTRFLVSRDNRNFQEMAVLEPEGSGDLPAQWRELLAGGAGEFRYLRAELPAGAAFAEIQWLEYPDWHYSAGAEKGRADLRLVLQVYDVAEAVQGKLITAVYNGNGVLKGFYPVEKTFSPGGQQQEEVRIPGLVHEHGDSYRILVWEEDGTPALEQSLQYGYTNAGKEFSVPNVFSDHMLLQADKPLKVWGTAPAETTVEVTLENTLGGRVVREAKADGNAQWEADMGSFSAGGDYTLTVRAGAKKRVFRELTFGDVWLCIGQSNMDYYMLSGKDTEDYLNSEQGQREVDNPHIRLLNLWNKGIGGAGAPVEQLPLENGETAWSPMNRDAANYCSAVGYYFAQGIQQTYHVPVGILAVAVGDTEINRWIPRGAVYGGFASTDGGLYHNRMSPFENLQIRGILMYQGEADQYRTGLSTEVYRDAMAGLVDHCREIWGEEIPFYWAQLTRYKKDESLVREGQRLALERVKNKKNTGMIALIDLYGEYQEKTGSCREDIHPHQKKEVAERFLRLAKRDVYGEPGIAVSGPVYRSAKRVGEKLELSFDCVGALTVLPKERYADQVTDQLIAKNGLDTTKPQEFEVAGADGVFVKAQAELKGDKVLVWSPGVAVPVAARYAWGAYPEMPNLTDSTGLPAAAFSTEKLK